MDSTQRVVVTTSRDEIRDQVANAISMKSNVAITVIDNDGINELSFRVTVTSHDGDVQLDTIIGVIDPHNPNQGKQTVTVYIPTSGEITASIQKVQDPE